MNLSWIKKVYLYLVSLISLVILVVAAIMLLNLALKAFVFTKADDANFYPPRIICEEVKSSEGTPALAKDPACLDPQYEQKEREAEKQRRSAQKQNQAANAIAMIIVATPVFLYHWKLARKES